jgi:hypothetical protein
MNLEEILAILDRIGGDNPPSSAELASARTELGRLLHTEARAEAPDLAVMTSIRDAYARAGDALAVAQAREQEERDRVANMLEGVEDPDAQLEEPEEPELAEESEEPEESEDQLPPPAPGDQPEQQQLPIAASASQAPPARVMPLRDAAARVLRRPPAPDPEFDPVVPGGQAFYLGNAVDRALTLRELALGAAQTTRSPSRGRHTVASFVTDFSSQGLPVLPGDKAGNTALLDEIVGPEAVAAAGGCCSLPTVIRTQNVLSSSARPLRDSLPTIGVQESGAVMYYPAICLPSDGAWLWTCSDDEAVDPEDPETWKNCTFIDCDEEARTTVEAIYKCLTIGEFKRRFATEQWVGILQATLALQARVAENAIWSKMLAGVTATCTAADTGSIFTNFVQTVQREADWIRQDQRYINVQMRVWVSQNIIGAIASDFAARRLEFADPTDVQRLINNALANANVNVTYLPDIDPMSAGGCAAYPATFTAILAPEGYYSFLDGGQFDLGVEIRDINLARQNAVAAFSESFEGVLARGCRAKRLNIPNSICTDAAGCLAVS